MRTCWVHTIQGIPTEDQDTSKGVWPPYVGIFPCYQPQWQQVSLSLFVAGLVSEGDTGNRNFKHTSRTYRVRLISGPNSPTKSHSPSSSLQNCTSKSSIIYLFPDRVVAEKAADFTPGERPRRVGISVSWQHFNIQGL